MLGSDLKGYLFALLMADAQASGYKIEYIGKYEACPESYYKIALFIESEEALTEPESIGFHFYRQNTNGTWSHKLGAYRGTTPETSGGVSKNDVDDKLIFDPEAANRNVKSEGGISSLEDYNVFVGYFAVVPINKLFVE